MTAVESAGVPMAKIRTESVPLLAPLSSSDGENHAEYRRRRDDLIYERVPIGGEAPYLADGWKISKKLKRQIRLSRAKAIDRQFEDHVWKFFYRMGYDDLNKGYTFTISYKAADGTYREKQVDIYAKDTRGKLMVNADLGAP
jgi:hypothetical protein